MARDWMIEGKYVEYCSCDLGCPCEAMADPTQGHCTGLVGSASTRATATV